MQARSKHMCTIQASISIEFNGIKETQTNSNVINDFDRKGLAIIDKTFQEQTYFGLHIVKLICQNLFKHIGCSVKSQIGKLWFYIGL